MRFELGKLELFGLDLGELMLRWWRGLNSVMPVPLADIFLRPAPRLLVHMEDEYISFVMRLPYQADQELLKLGYEELELLEDNSLYEKLSMGVSKKKIQFELVLPASQVIKKAVSVPMAARNSLQQMLGFQIARLTPFERDQVFYGVEEIKSDTATGMLDVELQVVPKSFAQKHMAQLERVCGLRFVRLRVPDQKNLDTVSNLLPAQGLSFGWLGRLNRNALLLLLLLVSVGLLMLAPVAKLRMEVVRGKQEIVALASKVEHSRTHWYDLQKNATSLAFILEQHAQHGRPAIVLEELSRLIPDTIYLTGMSMDKNKLEISGQGSGVVELVELLNASDSFEQARFATAVTRGHNNLDVFTISMQLVAGEQP